MPRTKNTERMAFSHFLITRFNLRNPKWDATKNNESLLTDDWMADRMELFGNYCFPSVAAQTNRDFTWLMCLDTTTSPAFKAQMETFAARMPNLKLLYVDGMTAFYPAVQAYVREAAAGKPYLITSRIDNDDCLHRDFIANIQKQFDRQDFLAIDSTKGYTLQVTPDFRIGYKEHLFNPFMSLIERNDDPKTVWFYDHTQWKREKRLRRFDEVRMWMSVIHQKNKVNEFDGYGKVDWEAIRRDFVLSEKTDGLVSRSLIPYENWKGLSLRNRLYVNFGYYLKLLKKKAGLYNLK